ncbi:MAG: endonuclease MutS2 [Oscillospiraceae bacterium]|jgi:DNA mismatch repair protein MutS2|nr:endonuclease MutS2 [Oscillospiraceae bacterium]
MFEKSLRILELPSILDMLAAEAASETAKEKARGITPAFDAYSVRSRLEETSDAKNMMAIGGSPPFSGVKDIRSAVRRAVMGGMLNTRELLDIAGLLRSSAAAIAYSSGGRDIGETAIDYLFSSIRANKYLENRISSAIVAEDELADSASSDLYDIRRHMRLASDKVRQALNKIITSPTYAKALQEQIITMKNGRYVVPVKAEQKSAVPGLVHDISSSGATLFIEPMAAVQINNELRELAAKEKQEIERILIELSSEVAEHGEDLLSDFEILVTLDLIFAKAKLSYKMNAAEPLISEDRAVRLRNARHPLIPHSKVVPIDVYIGDGFDTLVITGPNTGGKTVTLKTIGLLCAMAQCGLHIPATDGSILPVFSGILADIGDEQSIEQSLSTFSSHMTNIVGILDGCEKGSLLLFDELGAGTDPVEGAALAIAIIEHARGKGALIAATTHYAELKIYALTSPSVMNASCEFDVETLKPTYKLTIGTPGKSNAFAISQRLGLPAIIVEDAKSRVKSENIAFEDAVASLETARVTLEGEQMQVRRLLRDAEEDRRQAEEFKTKLERERENAAQNAKREAAKILEDARKTAESVVLELRDMQRKAASDADWKRLNEEKAEIFRRLNEAESDIGEDDAQIETAPQREIKPGDKVRLRGLGTAADVISVNRDGVLSLQAGIMKITARQNEVSLVEAELPQEVKKQLVKSETMLRELAAKPEIDLRGMQTDEAIPILERFLDNARMANLNSVTVIHGKGTGALRQAVHQSLKREHRIKSFRLGRYGEGEDGVTIVEF